MAVEEGFIQYTIDVKGADQARQDFDRLSDEALTTGKGFERLDKHIESVAAKFPRLAGRLRESSAELKKFQGQLKAEGSNATKTIDERRGAYLQEQTAVAALSDELERMTNVRKLDKEYSNAVTKNAGSVNQSGERARAREVGAVTAAQERLNKALRDEAKARSTIAAIGNPTGTGDAARTRAAVAAQEGLTSAVRETTAAQRSLAAAERQTQEESGLGLAVQRHAYEDLGRLYQRTGVVLAGIGVAALVIGAQFETAFSNVERTLDPAEFAAGELETAVDGIRRSLVQMTGELPLTFAELSQIATIGNQMGIAEKDLMSFTGTIARFSSVSGMSIEAVSQAFGGFMAQTGLAPKYLENFGSALAYVSIKSNATEEQILSVSREIAALSAGAGLGADQIVGLAGTLASLQIAPERARGSLETYFQTLRRAVAGGGEDLDNFAKVVGVTSSELDNMVRSGKGAEVLEGFLESLSNVDSIQVTQAMDALGLSQLRVANTFTRLSQNVGTLREQMGYAKSSFMEGAELNRQYEITLDTLNSQWTIFVNGINALVAAISGGAVESFGELFQAVNMVLFSMVELLNKNPWIAKFGLIAMAVIGVTGAFLFMRGTLHVVRGAMLAYQIVQAAVTAQTGVAANTNRAFIGSLLGVRGAATGASIALRVFRLALIGSGIGLAVAGLGILAEKFVGSANGAKDASIGMSEYNKMTKDAEAKSRGAAGGAEDLASSLGGGGGGAGGTPSVAQAAEVAAERIRLLTDYASDLQGVFKRSFSLRFDSGSAMDSVITKWNTLRDEAEKYRQEINKLSGDRALREYWLSVAEMYDDQLRASALRAEISDIDADLAKASKGASRELEGQSQAAIDNRATMRDLLTGYQDYIDALARTGASQQFIQSEVRRLSGQFMDQGLALGYGAEELSKYSIAFSDMSTIVSNVPRAVTIEFNGDPALTALAEFNAKLKEETAAAGAAAGAAGGDALGGGLGGALDGTDWDSMFGGLDSAVTEATDGAAYSLDAFWWDAGHAAIRGAGVIYGVIGGLATALEYFFSGRNFSDGFDFGFEKWSVEFKDQFGAIGFVASDAMGAGFKRGLKPGQWIADGVTYEYDIATAAMTRVGAQSAEEYNASLGAGIIPGPVIVDGLNYAKDAITGEIYKVGTASGAQYDKGIKDTSKLGPLLSGEIIGATGQVGILSAGLGRAGGVGFNSGVDATADPGGAVRNKAGTQDQINKASSAGASLGSSTGWSFGRNFAPAISEGFDAFFGRGTIPRRLINSMTGFQSGGYTGRGGVSAPAGIVHGKEYVIPAHGVDQRTRLPKMDYVQSLNGGTRAPQGSGFQGGGFVSGGVGGGGGGSTIELGEYTIDRLGRQVTVGLSVDGQNLARAASIGDRRLAQRGSN